MSEQIETTYEVSFIPPLYIQRYEMVFDLLNQRSDITTIADFGCSEGKLLRRLKKLSEVRQIICIDCDESTLDQCLYEAKPLNWDVLFGRLFGPLNISVYSGNFAQKDSRLKNIDAITCIEVIEHLSSDVLSQMAENIFGFIGPKVVIITTPNIEYNVLFPQLKESSKLRHWDHKFEWTRNQFHNWCQTIVNKYTEYSYKTSGVGKPPNHLENVGFCTQIAIFEKNLNNNKIESNSREDVDNYLNYKLIESYDYCKSTRTEEVVEEQIDWESVLKVTNDSIESTINELDFK